MRDDSLPAEEAWWLVCRTSQGRYVADPFHGTRDAARAECNRLSDASHVWHPLRADAAWAAAAESCATCGGEGHPANGPDCPECGKILWSPTARGVLTRLYAILRDGVDSVDRHHLRELIGEAQEVLGEAGDEAADRANPS